MTVETKRSLDASVAENVFRYERRIAPKDADGKHGGTEYLCPIGGPGQGFTYPPKGPIGFAYHVPRWSNSIQDAWPLIDYLNQKEVEVIIGCFRRGNSPQYSIELRRWRDRRDEGIEGDPHTHRSRETFVLKHGLDLPVLLCEAILDWWRWARLASDKRNQCESKV